MVNDCVLRTSSGVKVPGRRLSISTASSRPLMPPGMMASANRTSNPLRSIIRALRGHDWIWLALGCCSSLKLAHDGLEREFKFFNWLEGGVCAMCAPGDQRKSCHGQREPACGPCAGSEFLRAGAGECPVAVPVILDGMTKKNCMFACHSLRKIPRTPHATEIRCAHPMVQVDHLRIVDWIVGRANRTAARSECHHLPLSSRNAPERIDESAIPAPLRGRADSAVVILLLRQCFLDDRCGQGRQKFEEAVLIAYNNVARVHGHTADCDRDIDRSGTLSLYGPRMGDAARVHRKSAGHGFPNCAVEDHAGKPRIP